MKRLPFFILTWLLLASVLPGTLTAQTPGASPAASPVTSGGAWQVTDRREIDVDGVPLALSPDGQWIAGVGPEGTGICIWDVASLDPTCGGDDLRVTLLYISWAPDSSAIAFTDGQFAGDPLEPNTLWLFTVDGRLTELSTMESLSGEPVFHLSPVWTPNSQRVMFSLVVDAFGGDLAGTLWYADRAGSEPKSIGLPIGNYTSVVPIGDGLILLGIGGSAESGTAGIWRVRLDGSGLEQVLAASDVPGTGQVRVFAPPVDGRYLTLVSLELNAAGEFPYYTSELLVLDQQTGVLTPVQLPGDAVLVADAFAPSGASLFLFTVEDNAEPLNLEVLDVPTGETQRVMTFELPEDLEVPPRVSWGEDNRLLITIGTETTLRTLLLTLEPAL